MKFIQLCGAGRAGKTTVGNMLFDIGYEHNFIPIMLPFAKSLKDDAAEQGFTKDNNPEEYRKYCQKWGAGRREEDSNYWVNKTRDMVEMFKRRELQMMKDEERFEHLIIQDDVRYMNEIAYGREVGAYQIFITPVNRPLPELMEGWRKHESEDLAFSVELGDMDYTDLFHEYITNEGTIEELNKHIKERFITWVSTNDISMDPMTILYRAGEEPSTQFLQVFLERMHDEETNDSDS